MFTKALTDDDRKSTCLIAENFALFKDKVLIPEHPLVLLPYFDIVLIQSILLCSIKMMDEIEFLRKIELQ